MYQKSKLFTFKHLPTFVIFVFIYLTKNLVTTNANVNFTSNVNAIKVNQLTTFTCLVNNFDPTKQNYSINFYSKRDNLIATYEVESM